MKNTMDLYEALIQKINDDFERNENKALRKELLQDLESILYKVYSRIIPKMKINKNLSNEEIEKKIEFCLGIEMRVANQKSNREIYQHIKMYRNSYTI